MMFKKIITNNLRVFCLTNNSYRQYRIYHAQRLRCQGQILPKFSSKSAFGNVQSNGSNRSLITSAITQMGSSSGGDVGKIQQMPDNTITNVLDNAVYERVCTETLDGLCDYFEELLEQANHLSGSDVSYGDGVLTIKLGSDYGTYVINRQTPNKQIWLSSPTSGPKRYDFIGPDTAEHGKWIYKHTNETLHELLQHELPSILQQNVNFLQLPFGK